MCENLQAITPESHDDQCVCLFVLLLFNVLNSRKQDMLDEQNKGFTSQTQHFPSRAKRPLRASVYRAHREHYIGETTGDDVRVPR